MWTLNSCFHLSLKKLVELIVMMTTEHRWLNSVIINNNWLLWCKWPVLRALLVTLSTTCREESWYTKNWINIYLFHQLKIQGVMSCGRWCAWEWISPAPMTLQRVTTLPVSESAVPNNGNVIPNLSTTVTPVNDLVMLLYYDPCYAHRSSRSKEGFHQNCWYRSGGACCSHSEWMNSTSRNVPIPAHSVVSYLGPEQSRFQWRTPWTGCDTTSSFHGKVKKSAWECWKVVPHVTNAFVILTVYIYTDVPAAIWRFIWHNWTWSQTTVNVLGQCLFSWT